MKELDKHVLIESARVIQFNKFVEAVPEFIKENGGSAVVLKAKQFLDECKTGNEICGSSSPGNPCHRLSKNIEFTFTPCLSTVG